MKGNLEGAKRKLLYSICDEAGLWEVASKFGCSSEQFRLCCIKERLNSKPGYGNEIPEEVAEQFECEMFDTLDGVLKTARHMGDLSMKVRINTIMIMEKRENPSARSKYWFRMEYGRHLWSNVSMVHYQKTEANYGPEDESTLRVMACCWGPGNPATMFVMLDSTGELVDVLHAVSVKSSIQGWCCAKNAKTQGDGPETYFRFSDSSSAACYSLGRSNLSCRDLRDDVYEISFRMVEALPRDDKVYMSGGIVYGDQCLTRIYEISRLALGQVPDQPGIVRHAVGLGRYLLNPLAMIATLCGPEKEILTWKLCPLDHFLTPDKKFEMVEGHDRRN